VKATPNLPKLGALFALQKLSGRLRSDVMSDGSIAARFDIAMNRSIRLSDKAVVNRDTLFSAFRDAADGVSPQPLLDQGDSVVNSKVRIDDEEAGIVEIGTHRLRFPHAALLSGQPSRRLAVLQRALSKHSLAVRHAAALAPLVSRPDFSNDDFLQAVGLLSSTPEFFARLLRETVATRQVGEADLLPDDVRHWENLTAARDQSLALREFIDGELAVERSARIASDPVQGFRSISLTFSAPGLVPLELFREMDADTAVRTIEGIADVDDHFALAGAFEICTDWVRRDPRFIEVGDGLLDRLFGDMDRLNRGCGMFGAAFVIATARLAIHDSTRNQPVYWRRLAAASHAALVVRACGVTDIDHKELLTWAMHMRGDEYLLSVLSDMAIEPQWRPEWVDSGFLTADVFGRVFGAFLTLAADITPKSWQERIMKAKGWIDDNDLGPMMTLPAVLEGARRAHTPAIAELGAPAVDAYRRLSEEPSVDNLLRVAPLVQIFGVPLGINPDVLKVLHQVRNGTDSFDDRVIQAAITLAAHIAVLTNDVVLSEFVAETCLDKARNMTKGQSVHEVVYRLVECAAANTNRATARRALAQRLEALAFILPPSALLTSA
jgi:DNA-binding transcriptional regulator YdaS (Cro superfamily)